MKHAQTTMCIMGIGSARMVFQGRRACQPSNSRYMREMLTVDGEGKNVPLFSRCNMTPDTDDPVYTLSCLRCLR